MKNQGCEEESDTESLCGDGHSANKEEMEQGYGEYYAPMVRKSKIRVVNKILTGGISEK